MSIQYIGGFEDVTGERKTVHQCQFYHFKEHIEPKTYLEFDVPKNESFFVMALPKGWEVFMINQQWLFSSPSSITISSDMLLDISR